MSNKTCKICQETKPVDEFLKNRLTCKPCSNAVRREKHKENREQIRVRTKEYYERTKDYRNEQSRLRYETDAIHREKRRQEGIEYKRKKTLQRQQLREEEQRRIGLDNKQCKYCHEIKPKERFRYNRLKCRNCERDDPVEKFKRYSRTRIYNCLKRNKSKHYIEYLGCSSTEYFEWMLEHSSEFTLDNYGKEWHIDHVIPLSRFNIDDVESQMLAFNWRNTMPLSAKENLAKNKKILPEQVKSHLDKLTEYHNQKNIEFPQEFIDLFAKFLDVRENP